MPSYRLEPDDLADFDQLVPDFITLASEISDPRVEGRITHHLNTILFVCISASMAGAKSVNAFGQFAEDTWDWITACLGEQIGSTPLKHDTIGRVLQKLKPDITEQLLADLAKRKTDRIEKNKADNDLNRHVAIDGKRQAGTARKDLMNLSIQDGGQQPYNTVSAYSVGSGLVLGCHTSTEPGSEHKCVEQTLEMIDLRGAMVTMDAGNAYPKFCKSILNGKGSYLFCIKGNNARTQELCREIFDAGEKRAYSEYTETVKARGDKRMVRVAKIEVERGKDGTGSCDKELAEHWPSLVTVIEVQRERKTRNHQVDSLGNPKVSWHVVYYVCSKDLNAEEACRYIRDHWHVENKVHWTMDVAYGEDASRAKTGYIAQNLAAIKRISNNMLASITGKASTRRFQMKFAVDEKWRNQVWGLFDA